MSGISSKPAIPNLRPKGINDELWKYLLALKETIESYEGVRGDTKDKIITRYDLESAGIKLRSIDKKTKQFRFGKGYVGGELNYTEFNESGDIINHGSAKNILGSTTTTDLTTGDFTSNGLDYYGNVTRAKNGLLFGTDTLAANTLDDYEEGTFTPTAYYQNATDQANVVYTARKGFYRKIGKLVIASVYIDYSQGSTSPAVDNVGVGNLPFVSMADTMFRSMGGITITSPATAYAYGFRVAYNSTIASFIKFQDGSGNNGANVGTGNHLINATAIYFVD